MSAEAVGMAVFAAMLKTKYATGPGPVPIVLDQHVALGEFYKALKKIGDDPRAHGDQIVVPLRTSLPANVSATYASAYTYANAPTYDRFLLQLYKQYAVHFIDWEVLRRAGNQAKNGGDAAAYLSPQVDAAEQKMTAAQKHMSWRLWSGRGGAAAQLATTTNLATNVAVLRNPLNASRFDVGQWVEFSTSTGDTGGSLLNNAGTTYKLQVTAVDEDQGLLEFSDLLNTVVGLTTASYLFFIGDFGKNLTGVLSYVPITKTLAATTLNGLVRSAQPQRLGGYRVLREAGETPVQFLIKMLRKANTVGAPIKRIWVDPIEMQAVTEDLVSRELQYKEVEYNTDAKYGVIGFSAIRVLFPGMAQPVDLIADRYFAPVGGGHLYFGQCDSCWQMLTAGPFDWFADDGSTMSRTPGIDQYEAAWGGYAELECSAPGWNVIGGRASDGISLT